jgi:hypothetical protein
LFSNVNDDVKITLLLLDTESESEPVLLNVYGVPELIPRIEFRQPILAGRYDNPIPPRFLAPIDILKIPAQTMPTVFTVAWALIVMVFGVFNNQHSFTA